MSLAMKSTQVVVIQEADFAGLFKTGTGQVIRVGGRSLLYLILHYPLALLQKKDFNWPQFKWLNRLTSTPISFC